MIENLVRLSIERRQLCIALVLVIVLAGGWSYQRLAIDAVPDITNVQVQINTLAPGYSPLETEQRITYLLENALQGLPQLVYSRSLSRYGLSQVTLVFQPGTDIYFARNLINVRLSAVSRELPPGIIPELGPVATGLGEIFMYTLQVDPEARMANGAAYSLMDLREIQDWVIKPQLMQVPGVVEVNSIGGHNKQYHVLPDPKQLLYHGVGLQDLVQALQANNSNQGAGYIERNGQQLLVRSAGQLSSVEAIANVVIKAPEGIPVKVSDVAEVALGQALRSGAATRDGQETVLGTAIMLIGENSRSVASALALRLSEVQASLPSGVKAEVVYDRTHLVDKAIATVSKNLLEGALLVMVVLFVLLGNLRAALITAAVIPLSMLMTITGMVQAGVSANLMSLGALDFGLIVDGAVIIVENSVRRLAQAQRQGGVQALPARLQTVFAATAEVIRPSLLGVVIITLVYIPIFALTGTAGKMFHPMALTVVMALLAAMFLSLTLVPAAVALWVKGEIRVEESPVMRHTQRLYRPLLLWALRWRGLVLGLALGLVLLCGWLATTLGSEFIPQLDEGDIALHAMRIPGTGLQQSVAMQEALEQRLGAFAEVDKVFARIGTAEVATDPMPPNVADNFVILKPVSQWPDPDKSKEALVTEMTQALAELPGNSYEFTQPIEMRFNELISGVRADLGIKLFGDDLELLATSAQHILRLVNRVPGVADARVEPVSDLPTVVMLPKPEALGRYGLSVAELQHWLATVVAGTAAGIIYDGDRRFELLVRMPDRWRQDLDQLRFLPVLLPNGEYVPLSEVAQLKQVVTPAQISREQGKRRVVVTANVRGRDLGSFVAEVQARLREEFVLPPGYWLQYGGSFEQLALANQRLALVVPVTLVLIFMLLTAAFGSWKEGAIIFSGVPLALCGGVLALYLRDMPWSISAGVGFIALSGVAVLNGLVLVTFIRQRWAQTQGLLSAVIDGATTRLRPVLMTALVASLGFIPMALNTGIGAEVQRPLATVVIGGIITSTLLTLLLLPVLYHWLHSKDGAGAVR